MEEEEERKRGRKRDGGREGGRSWSEGGYKWRSINSCTATAHLRASP